MPRMPLWSSPVDRWRSGGCTRVGHCLRLSKQQAAEWALGLSPHSFLLPLTTLSQQESKVPEAVVIAPQLPCPLGASAGTVGPVRMESRRWLFLHLPRSMNGLGWALALCLRWDWAQERQSPCLSRSADPNNVLQSQGLTIWGETPRFKVQLARQMVSDWGGSVGAQKLTFSMWPAQPGSGG